MKTVTMILELAAPLQVGFHIRIENEPWMTLVIEDTQERGPNGLPAISVQKIVVDVPSVICSIDSPQ